MKRKTFLMVLAVLMASLSANIAVAENLPTVENCETIKQVKIYDEVIGPNIFLSASYFSVHVYTEGIATNYSFDIQAEYNNMWQIESITIYRNGNYEKTLYQKDIMRYNDQEKDLLNLGQRILTFNGVHSNDYELNLNFADIKNDIRNLSTYALLNHLKNK